MFDLSQLSSAARRAARSARRRDAGETDLTPDVISISHDRLALILAKFFEQRKTASDWVPSLGIAISLWTLLPITTFVDRVGLKADQWQLLVIVAAAAFSLLFLVNVKRAFRAPSTADLLSEIHKHADVLDEHRGLLFLKCLDSEQSYRVLVYWDIIWGCYLLPHLDIRTFNLSDENDLDSIAIYAARSLGLMPESVVVRRFNGAQLRTRKFDEFYRLEKAYTFEFLHITLSAPLPEHIGTRDFSVGGRRFKWATIDSLMEHEATGRRNGDVLGYIFNDFVRFFVQCPDTISNSGFNI